MKDRRPLEFLWVREINNKGQLIKREIVITSWCEECGSIKFSQSRQWMKPRREQNAKTKDKIHN